MSDLSLIPIHDLITELLSRCEHGLVMLMMTERTGSDMGRVRYHEADTGNSHAVAGLAMDMAVRVLNRQRGSSRHEEAHE